MYFQKYFNNLRNNNEDYIQIIYEYLWENYGEIIFAIEQNFFRGKKGNYFWKKPIFYWLIFSNNQ